MSAAKSAVKLHIHLMSEMKDAYQGHHTVGRAAIDVSPSDTVEKMKFAAFAALGEFAELRDVHHTTCRFICGTRVISAADDSKSVSEVGVAQGAELHVILPFGHDSILCQPQAPAAAKANAEPASPTVKIHARLKSMIRDSYDGVVPAGKGEIDVDVNTSILDFKGKIFGALGEIDELRDIHHTHCSFLVEGGDILSSDKDSKRIKDFPFIKDGVTIDVMLPIGHAE